MTIPNIHVNPSNPKGNYGKVMLAPAASLLGGEEEKSLLAGKASVKAKWPKSFEELGQAFGLIMYDTKVTELFSDPALLKIPGIRDRGYVYVDGELQGILSRQGEIFSMPLSILPGQKLQIIVENQGRICFGTGINDFKGIVSNVSLDRIPLKDWTMIGYPLNDALRRDYALTYLQRQLVTRGTTGIMILKALAVIFCQFAGDVKTLWKRNKGSMSFWIGSFKTACQETRAKDSFLKLPYWRKGVAFLNGINLGRYWPVMGPQITLYVPGVWIKPKCQLNTLVIFEQDESPCLNDESKCFAEFVSEPDIDGPTPVTQ